MDEPETQKDINPIETPKTETAEVNKPKHTNKNPWYKQRKWQIISAAVAVVAIAAVIIAFSSSSHYMTAKYVPPTKTNQPAIGDSCATANSTTGTSGTTLICKQINGKLIWQSDAPTTNEGNANSLNPIIKGEALSNGECTGSGSTTLTNSPLSVSDIGYISPMGTMVGGHVTPVDHEYYYQLNASAPADTYPVYATAAGSIVGVEVNYHNGSSPLPAWSVVLSHSCTFFTMYNLMTSIAPSIKAALPATWSDNSAGGIKIPVTAGELIGYVGGQSLDFSVVNTNVTLKGFLYPTAYNNAQPEQINTVEPLDYFSSSVKSAITPYYLRTATPLDGTIDYDVSGEAVGNWFVVGSNGYAGTYTANGTTTPWATHLALAYDNIDPSAETFSIGDYDNNPNNPTQFAVTNSVDWTKITPSSGMVKIELAQPSYKTQAGIVWSGGLVKNLKFTASTFEATALVQMTDANHMKVQVFPGQTASQVSGFTSAAVLYNRGQDAKMVASNTATN